MLRNFAKFYLDSLRGLSPTIWLLALVTLINRSGAMVLPFMTVYLTTSLNFTVSQTGYLMGAFGLGSVVGSYLGGKLTDIIGYFKTMLWSLLLSGGMFFVLMEMTQFYHLAISIFILSLITDIFRPALFSSVAIFSKVENRTRSISLIRLAINLGYGVGPAIGGLLIASVGYKSLFMVDGITCILAGLFIWWKIPAGLTNQYPSDEPEDNTIPVSIFKDPDYLCFLFLLTLIATVFMQLIYTIPVYFKTILLFNEDTIGKLMALNGLIVAFIEMPLVHFVENKKSYLYWVIVGSLMVGGSYLLLLFDSGGLGLAILFVVVISVGEVFKFPFTNSFALSRTNDHNRGSYLGYYSMSFSISLIFAPIVGLKIVDYFGFNTLWNTLGIISMLVVFGFFGLKQKLLKVKLTTL